MVMVTLGYSEITGRVQILLFVLEDSTIRPPKATGSPGEAVVHPAVQGKSQDSLDWEDQRVPGSGRVSLKATNPRSTPFI